MVEQRFLLVVPYLEAIGLRGLAETKNRGILIASFWVPVLQVELGKLSAIERIVDMSDATNEYDQTDDFLTHEVTDDALELASASGNNIARHYTLFYYYCTSLQACPGP